MAKNQKSSHQSQTSSYPSNVVLTGGCGFVGHHLVEHLLKKTDWNIHIFDKMSKESISKARILDIDVYKENRDRVHFHSVNLNLPIELGVDKEVGKVDYIFHLAAESHVDRSIEEPVPFVLNNVQATLNMLEYARKHPELKMFINFSTDEVYGPAPKTIKEAKTMPQFQYLSEDAIARIVEKGYPEFFYHNPTNPYSMSKSAQEKEGRVWANCWGVPLINTHTMNIIGERQHPEKFVPLVINKVLNGEKVEIHANKDKTAAGTRFYIHARNLSDALLHIVRQGYSGYDEWNIAGLEEIDNLTLAQKIADVVGKPLKYEMVDFHSSRPGHDLRYALDSTKLLDSGYNYPQDLSQSLESTVRWTVDRRDTWLNPNSR